MSTKKIVVDLRIKTRWCRCAVVGNIVVFGDPAMPGLVKLAPTREVDGMLQFKLILPAPGASDVVNRELSVTIADGDPVLQEVSPGIVEVAGFAAADGASVAVALTDVDDAGNRSEIREQSFTLADTIPPPQPGEIGLVVTGEE